jgi:hypothetical protein
MNAPSVVPIVGLAIVNGMFSPFLAFVFALQGLWYPFFLPAQLPLVFTLSSLLLATLYLMLSGVPAAIYERLTGQSEPGFASRIIWLAAMALMTLPSLPFVLRALGFS